MAEKKINTLKIELELASYDELPEGESRNAFLDEILETVNSSTYVGNVTAMIHAVEEAEDKDTAKETKK